MHVARPFLIPALLGALSGMVFPGITLAADPPPSVSSEDIADASALRKKALAHFDAKEYAEAVELFQKSLVLERKAGAMANMASALNQLGRYEEALRWYETVLAEFPNASDKLRRQVDAEMKDLAAKVGTIAVEGDAKEGFRLFIDNRDVGAWPLSAPVRVLGGVHEVRAVKPGFSPLITSIEVTAGQASVAKLVAKVPQAKLDIREKHNWIVHVEIDGVDQGLTPLLTTVEPGEHRIHLRGYMQPDVLLACETPEQAVDMGARMESEEKMVKVGLFETRRIDLSAEDMDGSLHVESTPKGATLWIDGHEVGKTPWDGRLPLGEHTLDVRAQGFFVAKQQITLQRRKPRDLAIVLERLPDRAAEERAATNARIAVGLAYGAGGVGLGMFGIAGSLALGNRRALQANCTNGQCPSTQDARLQELNTLGAVATIGLVITGVGAAGGTALLLLNRSDEHRKKQAPSVNVGMGWGSVQVAGSF